MVNCAMERFEEVLAENKSTLIELMKQPASFALRDSPYPSYYTWRKPVMQPTISNPDRNLLCFRNENTLSGRQGE